MNIEKYTQKTQSILQLAQTIALGMGNQKFLPEHLLSAMLEDSEGFSEKLITLADGNIDILKAENDKNISAIPKVQGSGAGNITMSQELARIFLLAEKLAHQNGDEFVTLEFILLAILQDDNNKAANALKLSGLTVAALKMAIEKIRAGKKASSA